jgi:hypothetical protein
MFLIICLVWIILYLEDQFKVSVYVYNRVFDIALSPRTFRHIDPTVVLDLHLLYDAKFFKCMTLISLVCICFQFAILFFVKDNISRYNFHFIGQLSELPSVILPILAVEDKNCTSPSGNLIKVLAFGKLLYLLTKEVEYFFTICGLDVASQKTFITKISIMFAIFIVCCIILYLATFLATALKVWYFS